MQEDSAVPSGLSGELTFVSGVTLRSPPACNLASPSCLLFQFQPNSTINHRPRKNLHQTAYIWSLVEEQFN
jgi:hypothetical protein